MRGFLSRLIGIALLLTALVGTQESFATSNPNSAANAQALSQYATFDTVLTAGTADSISFGFRPDWVELRPFISNASMAPAAGIGSGLDTGSVVCWVRSNGDPLKGGIRKGHPRVANKDGTRLYLSGYYVQPLVFVDPQGFTGFKWQTGSATGKKFYLRAQVRNAPTRVAPAR